ncbi:hypothetical protein HX021_19810 [Sphingobacterium sp. N143]|uniref:hypothetical protein n=1 Tax=Sphingobacterium sp. N143 TaxID=2746727 RepID=UPI0025760C4D|nr:hypothetical protein [Sphingobacterium sp. N143]MDM1296538.1 hypothetical protein [Sphingobacterium sp. N143]
MRKILQCIILIFIITSCRKQHDIVAENADKQTIEFLQADFKKQTGYNDVDSNFVNSNFKSVIDWNTYRQISSDTVYVKVKLLDRVEVLWDTLRIDIKENVWIRAINKEKKWDYKLLTFIKEDNLAPYSGAILARSLPSTGDNLSLFQDNLKVDKERKLRAGWAPVRECIEAYVEGQLNRVSCQYDLSRGGGDDIDFGRPSPGDYNNVNPGGSAGGGGNSNNNAQPPTADELKLQLEDKPFALIPDIPCEVIKKWIATAKHQVQQAQIDKLNQIRFSTTQVPWAKSEVIAKVQKIDDAHSTVVNMDYFPITVTELPIVNGKRLTPAEFIKHIRLNINNFINKDYSSFAPYNYLGIDDTNLWNSSNPINAVVGIDIPGVFGSSDNFFDDDAAVIVSKSDASGWTFTTIFDPIYGSHPVSGNRDFGFTQNSNGSYTFYTRGVDRLTDNFGAVLQQLSGTPFTKADQLWTSFQEMVSEYVNQHGGSAAIAQQEIHRPNWALVKDVIDGKKPLSTLSNDCK